MPHLPRFRLSDAEKDALLTRQQDLIEQQALQIQELEALLGRPRKTSSNSHVPPSKDGIGRGKAKAGKVSSKPRPPREGKARPLTETPDRTERVMAAACGHAGRTCRARPSAVGTATITSTCRRSGRC